MKEPECRHCGSNRHYSAFCFARPKPKIKPGKTAIKWQEVRKAYFEDNPPDKDGFYYCYLRISFFCTVKMHQDDIKLLTLDHIRPRSNRPDQLFDNENLRPACWYCNGLKGSRSLERLSIDYPHLKQYI